MKDFKFKNLDSESEITVPLNTAITYIYGVNGSGKTTFSKEVSKKLQQECMVFNTDFINKNVYIVDHYGAKTDTNTKENFTSLFIGEQSVYYNKEIKSLNERLSDIKKLIDIQETKLSNILKDKKLPISKALKDYEISKEMYSFIFDKSISIKESQKAIIFNTKFITSINSEEEFNLKLNHYLENKTFNNINSLLNGDENLKKIFNNNSDGIFKLINEMIVEYNIIREKIKEDESILSQVSDPISLKK